MISAAWSRLNAAISAISDPITVFANLASVAVMALAGVVLNLGIGRVYGFDGLGVFSLALIFFLIFGQIAAGGFAFGALYHFSRHGADVAQPRAYLLAVFLPVAGVGAVIACGLYFAADIIGGVLDSAALAGCLPAVGLAIFLFGLNKIGINALNGMSHLKTYALLQGLRMPLMLAAFVTLTFNGASSAAFGWIFVTSETIILFLLMGFIWRYTPPEPLNLHHIAAHLRASGSRGWRGALIGILADVNSKTDILVLGLLLPDKIVGIYALGAMFSDGLRMVLAAIQSVVNPSIATYIAQNDRKAFDALWRNVARTSRPLALLITVFATLFLIYLAPGILGAEDVTTSTTVFIVIALASVLAAPAIVLNQSFTQGGNPERQTIFLATLAAINLILNLILIPIFGPVGAAIATGIAEAMQLLILIRWLPKIFK